jgi:hypothetical protein
MTGEEKLEEFDHGWSLEALAMQCKTHMNSYKNSKLLGAGKTHGPLFYLDKAEQHSKLGALMTICYNLMYGFKLCRLFPRPPPLINLKTLLSFNYLCVAGWVAGTDLENR